MLSYGQEVFGKTGQEDRMTREEFLQGLRSALEGNVSSGVLQDNLDYYSQYILDEMRNGKTEAEVVQTLGDPWVIARTIISANDGTDEAVAEETRGAGRNDHIYYENSDAGEDDRPHAKVHFLGIDTWWKKLLVILSVVLVIVIVVAVITGIISLLAPIIVPIVIVLLIIRLINGGRRR